MDTYISFSLFLLYTEFNIPMNYLSDITFLGAWDGAHFNSRSIQEENLKWLQEVFPSEWGYGLLQKQVNAKITSISWRKRMQFSFLIFLSFQYENEIGDWTHHNTRFQISECGFTGENYSKTEQGIKRQIVAPIPILYVRV